MPSTTTRDPSTDGTADQAAAAEPVPAAELAGRGEGPPAVIKDSRASFALFASFIAVLLDEEKLNSPGEIPDVAAGATKQAIINLKPGNYAMFCNLPGHYAAGMYGTLTVK